MSRLTPVPEVVVSSNIITDDETGENLATIIVEARVVDFSNGFIFLDDPGDLYLPETLSTTISPETTSRTLSYEDRRKQHRTEPGTGSRSS